ncbi:MAG TPA: M15 family metallopeptidase [Mycobacteriales bacterium]|nr:M15 family metallopeptidase [Mycobacteriales bacterium]
MRALPVLGLLLAVTTAACGGAEPVARQASPSPSPTTVTTSSSPSPTQTRTRTAAPTPTPTPSPRLSASATVTASSSTYRWSSRRVTPADLPHSWRPGCPVAPAQLRLLTLPYRDFAGARRTGEIVVHARVADDVVAVFRDLYAAGFPIRSLRRVDEFGGDDDRSMAADNTSAFNCRDAVGGSGWSQHAYGLAIDVNPVENPYVYGGRVLPPAGEPYADRTPRRRGMAYPGGALNRAFAARGWSWGGQWRNPDYQHFSTNGQ